MAARKIPRVAHLLHWTGEPPLRRRIGACRGNNTATALDDNAEEVSAPEAIALRILW